MNEWKQILCFSEQVLIWTNERAQYDAGKRKEIESPYASTLLSIFKAYRLFLPLCRPVIKHELSDVARTLAGTEQVLPGLTAHEDQA